MNKDDLIVKKSELKEKNSKEKKISEIELEELLAGIRTMLKSDK